MEPLSIQRKATAVIYTLKMCPLNFDGERTESVIELATVDTEANRVSGPLADAVRHILSLDSVRLGVVGESVQMEPTRAWLVAYSLTIANGTLQAAGFEYPGIVEAFETDGHLLAMPDHYLDNFGGCIVHPQDV